MSLNDYLAHKRTAVLARQERVKNGTAQAVQLHAHVTAEGRVMRRSTAQLEAANAAQAPAHAVAA